MKGYVHRTFSPAEGNGRIVPLEDGSTLIAKYDEADGIFVPNPARPKPKPGHWRTTPGGRVRMKPNKRAGIAWDAMSGRVDGDYTREQIARKRSRRERRAALIAELESQGYL